MLKYEDVDGGNLSVRKNLVCNSWPSVSSLTVDSELFDDQILNFYHKNTFLHYFEEVGIFVVCEEVLQKAHMTDHVWPVLVHEMM